jgi:hypothetical protein
VAGDAWYPDVLVLPGTLGPDERDQVRALVTAQPRVALAAATADAGLMGAARVDIDAAGRAVLQPFGLPFVPQRLSGDVLAALARLVTAGAETPAESEAEEWSDLVTALETGPLAADSPDVASADSPDVASAATPDEPGVTAPAPPAGPYLRLLGPVELTGHTGTTDPGRGRRLTEYLAFLVLHPGAGPEAIEAALWPDRAGDAAATRNSATSKLRKFLGDDPEGRPYLPMFAYDASRVGCDWLDWLALVGDAPAAELPTATLAAAWSLVRGLPLSGGTPKAYRWAELWRDTMSARLSDVAFELARRRCQAKDFGGANAVLATALTIGPGQERLWRLRLLACYAAGDRAATQAAIDSTLRLADGLALELEPDTTRLITQIRATPLMDNRRRPRRD